MRLTRVEINLTALQQNVDAVRRHLPRGLKMMGLVKANAYGHGLVDIAQALVRYGIDYLGVGFVEEGITLRERGVTCPILVLGGVLGHQLEDFFHYDLEITISSLEIARHVEEAAKRRGGYQARVHLKIDTGMERIGVRAERAVAFVEQVKLLPHLEVVGLYSHFATSDERDKSFAREQIHRFTSAVDQLRKKNIHIPLVHIANSGGILDIPESYFSMVRPGIILYGIYPSRSTSESIPIVPVLSLKSNVVFVKEVEAGTSISYGRTYTTKEKTKIVTIPIGYGDGYSRRLSNCGEVLMNGKRFPVVGTVCMDQLMVDVGLSTPIHVGDDVVLIGSDGDELISAWDVADRMGTIPYEVCTGITARVPRIYIQ